MAYELSVTNIHKRTEEIQASVEASSEQHFFEYFRDTPQNLPFIQVPISLLVYRMANFRTNIQQLTLLSNKKLAADFFTAGEENISAQREQHDLLWKLAQKGQGSSIIAVSRVLKEEGQRQPLLITHTGVVVNGNRRLAAMRELGVDDDRFKYVTALVLPKDAREDEIIDMELSLQMAPETKLPYGWANDALAIESLAARGMKPERIYAKMRIDQVKYDEMVGSLQQAKLFLRDFVGEPEKFDLVDDMQQIFFNGYRAIKAKKTIDEKEAVRAVLFNIADQSTHFAPRAYDFVTPFEKDSTVLEILKSDLEDDMATYLPKKTGGSVGGLVPTSFDQNAPKGYEELTQFLLDKENKERVHYAIKDAVERFRENRAGKGDADRERLRKAKKHLANVTFSEVSAESRLAIPQLLVELKEQVNELSAKFTKLKSDAPAPS